MMKLSVVSVCVAAFANAQVNIKAQAGSKYATDIGAINAVRLEAAELMATMLGKQAFLQFPKGGSANEILNDMYLTESYKAPGKGINVVEKAESSGEAFYDQAAIAGLKRFFLRLAGKSSFLQRPTQQVNIGIASFLDAQQKDINLANEMRSEAMEKLMNEGEARRNSFINDMFKPTGSTSFLQGPIVTLGLSPPPMGLKGVGSFLENKGVRVAVASEPVQDVVSLNRAASKRSFLADDVRVQAGSQHWPQPAEVMTSFMEANPGADMGALLKVAQANLAAAKSYQEAASSSGVSSGSSGDISFLQFPAPVAMFMEKMMTLGGDNTAPKDRRDTQAPMVWLRE